MKILKWVLGITAVMVVLLLSGGIYIINKFSMSSNEQVFTQNIAEEIRNLDTPFHIILNMPGYEAIYLQRDGDLVSTWGYTVLKRISDKVESKNQLLQQISDTAIKYRWQTDSEDASLSDIDLASYRVSQTKPLLSFIQTTKLNKGQEPATRYYSQFWLSDDMTNLIVAFRVDAE